MYLCKSRALKNNLKIILGQGWVEEIRKVWLVLIYYLPRTLYCEDSEETWENLGKW